MSDTARIGRASLLLGSGTIVSRVLGFVRVAVLAYALGQSHSVGADAYQTATNVPSSIYALIAGGLLTAVLVPQIVRASTGEDRGQAYINKLLTIAILAFAMVTVAATVLAPVLMFLFGERGDLLALATLFAYWSLPQVFFLGLYTVLGEVLNARRSFGPFTWAPVLNNVVSIASLILFVAVFGSHIGAPASAYTPAMIALVGGGSTLGIAAQALILTWAWKRTGLTFRPDFRWRGVGLHATGKAAGWTFAMLIATQIAGAIENTIELIPTGDAASTATISGSWLIFMLPHSIITVSLMRG
jgi:putative peptidoglycan lipid II flippase